MSNIFIQRTALFCDSNIFFYLSQGYYIIHVKNSTPGGHIEPCDGCIIFHISVQLLHCQSDLNTVNSNL